MQDFVVHHDAIAKLIAKAPRLESLLTLGAEVAMRAGRIDRALAYLDRTQEFLNAKRDQLDQKRREISSAPDPDEENSDRENDQDEFNRLKREFVRKYNDQVVQR